jgi:hypothetical protein|tara:strand:+ start:61 stop:555 length:495 start_codon:yes stop_codon:yes gene_type:complete
MINVTNNYLENKTFYMAKDIIFSDKFPWTFILTTEDLKYLKFFHSLISINKHEEREVSPFMSPTISSLLKGLNVEKVNSADVLLISRTNKNIDIPIKPNFKTNLLRSILCLNSTNSSVCVGGGDQIECVENRLITLPSNISYNLTSPTDKNYTCWINIEYEKSL